MNTPKHWLTQTRRHDDGYTERHTSASEHLTATEAQKSRIQRLRDAGTPYHSGHDWVTYRDDHPGIPADLRCEVRLEWSDHNPDA